MFGLNLDRGAADLRARNSMPWRNGIMLSCQGRHVVWGETRCETRPYTTVFNDCNYTCRHDAHAYNFALKYAHEPAHEPVILFIRSVLDSSVK
ncbi:hypothetical protein EVAR_32918_1 [Eumeta japonica]|uniref:Uncharacterized protein n=1 Tax=Eumeta variegata TaxID=151549 RepID=A0A4C1X2N2_EUMVA|nr:hypothetical protein EVAR_32918_1 [Eumeta japonica]